MIYSCLCKSFVSCYCVLTEKIYENRSVVTIDHFSRLRVGSLLVSYRDSNVWPGCIACPGSGRLSAHVPWLCVQAVSDHGARNCQHAADTDSRSPSSAQPNVCSPPDLGVGMESSRASTCFPLDHFAVPFVSSSHIFRQLHLISPILKRGVIHQFPNTNCN